MSEKKDDEWADFVGKVVVVQFLGNMMLCSALGADPNIVPAAIKNGEGYMAVQFIENVFLTRVSGNSVHIRFRAPDGSECKVAFARQVVAAIWSASRAPTKTESPIILGN